MTGDPSPYDDQDVWKLVYLLNGAFTRYGPGDPDNMEVEADIQWAGEFNPKRRRTTRLDRLRGRGLPKVRAAAAEAVALDQVKSRPAPKSPGAQVRALQKTKAGRAHWARAGLDVKPRTIRRWLSGGKPSAGNLAKLQAATTSWHTEREGRAGRAAWQAANALDAVMMSRYAEVKFFNPISIRFT